MNTLIWASDLKALYHMVETADVPPKARASFEETKRRMLKNRGGDSVFSLFLEVDEPLESFSEIAHGHFFYTPSRLGLGETHRKELRELLQDAGKMEKVRVLAWLDRFIRLNTYEISIPGLKDPSLVPRGKNRDHCQFPGGV
jgi:hypothetical protein